MTLMIMPILLFMSMMIVPFFVYTMKLDHVNMVANHALKEAESVGYVSPAIMVSTNKKLEQLGMGETSSQGNLYPSYEGSTDYKVLRDASDPLITFSLRYPAPNLFGMLPAIGGSSSSGEQPGYYHILLYGKSEAYE
ncbi:MAG: hypothetical protein K6T85_08100 [Gorillibacterium sp.]|nr:hypothetical protein [Gorillibacterium sp.]